MRVEVGECRRHRPGRPPPGRGARRVQEKANEFLSLTQVSSVGVDFRSTGLSADGIVLPQDLYDFACSESRPRDERSLLSQSIDQVADQLADHILATADVEPAWQDPARLPR